MAWDYITAGFTFLYGIGLWQEYCYTIFRSGVPDPAICRKPGDPEWSPDRADLWSFNFHINFYLR